MIPVQQVLAATLAHRAVPVELATRDGPVRWVLAALPAAPDLVGDRETQDALDLVEEAELLVLFMLFYKFGIRHTNKLKSFINCCIYNQYLVIRKKVKCAISLKDHKLISPVLDH